MNVVKIHSIDKQGVLSNDDYAWLQENIGLALCICSIDWHADGKLCMITVWRGNRPVVLFDTYGILLEFVSSLPKGRFKL